MTILIATKNSGKMKEFREMLGGDRFQWTSLLEHPEIPEAQETGTTFHENAALKAATYAQALGCWAIADDSGLEVDALDGKPGVHSARWAAMHQAGQGDAANNALLLEQLKAVPDAQRTARFVCELVLADSSGKPVLHARDSVEGKILRQPRGRNGFGYDPLFWIESLNLTTAELRPEQKHRISHRGKALRNLRKQMESLTFAD